ncbi:hypothetical protein L1987_32831 [Smallanthus sonchifolius]|uniref:Uncharacterized protein n=1 Tax=Smallanthus sonchifolius TaxID=185202 RepID=A0ACB9HNP4_9ASTR|nr:hypothetical protein L1987_32831 [Smallanthus sonchifolius]
MVFPKCAENRSLEAVKLLAKHCKYFRFRRKTESCKAAKHEKTVYPQVNPSEMVVPSFHPVECLNWDFSAWVTPRTNIWEYDTKTFRMTQLCGLQTEIHLSILVQASSKSVAMESCTLFLLVILIPLWSSSIVSSKKSTNPVAQLLDNGNLVIREESRTVWQSFDYPGDTYLPGMKIGKDLITGIDRQFISWKRLDDPSPVQYVVWMNTNGFPQIFERQGSVLHTRLGPWNGVSFSGMPSVTINRTIENEFVMNEKEIYYKIEVDRSVVTKLYLKPEGGQNDKNMAYINVVGMSSGRSLFAPACFVFC